MARLAVYLENMGDVRLSSSSPNRFFYTKEFWGQFSSNELLCAAKLNSWDAPGKKPAVNVRYSG